MANKNPSTESKTEEDFWSTPVAIFLIGLGILFLLNNFGIVSWSVWGQIWKLWPIAIIWPGISLLIKSNGK